MPTNQNANCDLGCNADRLVSRLVTIPYAVGKWGQNSDHGIGGENDQL